jgi:hypothetical protein
MTIGARSAARGMSVLIASVLRLPAAPLDVRRGRHAGRHVSANLFLIAGLVVVILFPGITTWLPGVFGMR